ncbi:PREDICTED: pentatricopeptide repeat-containing protein At5g27460 isoform X1 [Ipomoea nil]|uniref:pentatricopeptide repeat-containing protein At5g27460 isoform X1 n=1 Tax=Ipomoea nil TaxID=35883 RepID=UPI0009012BD6|nr:PREDICTED: pentatricopeptide repeat-containing protein At5g27460 isoform X1 [Ipomoea nil]
MAAVRRIFLSLRSVDIACVASSWRHISSSSLQIRETAPYRIRRGAGDELKSWIFNSVCTQRSTTAVLQNWVDDGRRISVSELRRISRQLMKRRRFKPAFEILMWMETQDNSWMCAADYAIRLELTIKIHGSEGAEEYFDKLPGSVSKKASCLRLLRCYAKERDTGKAEALMAKMNGMGLAVTTQPFNEMMKLYMATSQYTKVPSVILQMKHNCIPLNVLSYNLWMTAYGDLSDIESVEAVYKEMMNDPQVGVGWSSLCTLANIYQKAGLIRKAILVLRVAEKKLSNCNRLAYFFIITLYTSLNDKEGVLRLWEASKAVKGRMTCANYMCMLSSLVKLGEIEDAQNIFEEWESQCRAYDVRVPNILLGAYMRNGLTGKAELLYLRTLEKGGVPNYKTWEILMEGWVRSQNIEKAIDAIQRALAMSKDCDWRPSPSIVVTIANYLQKSENFEEAVQYLRALRKFNLASLPVYKSLLRMRTCSQKSAQKLLELMQKDGINMDDETRGLVQTSRSNTREGY